MSEHEAGRETDALVAERLGWKRSRHATGAIMVAPPAGQFKGVPLMPSPYSTDIAAAWTLVEKMIEAGHRVSIAADKDEDWRVEVDVYTPDDEWNGGGYFGRLYVDGRAPTAPLAIVRAFLAATEPTP